MVPRPLSRPGCNFGLWDDISLTSQIGSPLQPIDIHFDPNFGQWRSSYIPIHPPVIKHGLLENPPFPSMMFPIETIIYIEDFQPCLIARG